MTTTTSESAVMAHLRAVSARQQAHRASTVNGAPTYRDAGTRENYTVGYGGERIYNQPVQTTVEPATVPMVKLIDALLVERQYAVLTAKQIEDIKGDKAQAHRFIKFLIGLPKVQAQPVVEAPVEPVRARLNFAEILDGNYAVRVDGVVKFYRVSTNERGFKNVQARASDALHMMFGKSSIAVLHRIVEAGLAESRMLFAQELGRCWKCGKSLTDEESRARGMGPDCASR